ncbi:hypothetical protein [Thermoanaerobacterium sp. DL9XJH110]|uniref:hypothetical protein n=1 Tax=Thermoanaerobacterium sp. DL9XJH110 TaxID=3386643 RepID=UPI000EA959D9|nr:hypothetical protein DXT63_08545 [Thermoanaerobacteraceae bacterium SP2]
MLEIGTPVKVSMQVTNHRRETVKGRIIKEYENFYLLQTEHGYKECLNKSLINIGDIKILER